MGRTGSSSLPGQTDAISENELRKLGPSWKGIHVFVTQLEIPLPAVHMGLNREVESRTAAGKVVPVARASLAYQSVARQPLRLALELALAPYFDTYARIPYQRFTLGASVDWRPSEEWRLIASFSGALAPYTVRAPESCGTAGLSASFSPVPFLVLTMGGFSLSQFQGETQGGGAFRQWTGYFSVALRDQFAL